MVIYRKIAPAEQSLYCNHLLRLDREDRHSRFHGPVHDEAIEDHCRNIRWLRTLVFGAFIDGEMRGAVELCGLGLPWSRDAELAVSVERAFQGMGVGTALVRRGMLAARNRWMRRVTLVCLSGNRRMRRIATRFSGDTELAGCEITSGLTVGLPNPVSLGLELGDDGFFVVQRVLDGIVSMADRLPVRRPVPLP